MAYPMTTQSCSNQTVVLIAESCRQCRFGLGSNGHTGHLKLCQNVQVPQYTYQAAPETQHLQSNDPLLSYSDPRQQEPARLQEHLLPGVRP